MAESRELVASRHRRCRSMLRGSEWVSRRAGRLGCEAYGDDGFCCPTVQTAQPKCPICLEWLRGHRHEMLACGHYFHTSCLNAHIRTGDHRCPVCRSTSEQRQHVYDDISVIITQATHGRLEDFSVDYDTTNEEIHGVLTDDEYHQLRRDLEPLIVAIIVDRDPIQIRRVQVLAHLGVYAYPQYIQYIHDSQFPSINEVATWYENLIPPGEL